jgi:hypothetical protein
MKIRREPGMNQPLAGVIDLRTHRAKAALLLCAAAWLATAAGCGSSVYADKFQHRLEELKTSAEFSAVLTDLPTEGLPINFRIPKAFTKAFNQVSIDEETKRKISPAKFAPACLPDFPGLQRMFEGQTSSKDLKSKVPFFLYVGEGDAAAVKGKFPYEEWRERIKRGRLAPGQWEDVDAPTPKGEKLKWKRLIATGKHVWDVTPIKTNTTEYPSLDTFFQMWVFESPQTIAILGWWSTEDARGPSDIEKLAKLTAGTAVVSPTAAAPVAAPIAPAKAK